MSWIAIALGFLKRVPWQLWAVLAVIATGWFYGNHRYGEGVSDERAVWEQRIAEAEKQVRKAERDAARKFEGREGERQADTNELREAAAKADDGAKVKAVLDALRGSGT